MKYSIKFTNNASSALAGSIGTTDTTIQLQTGGGAKFPAIVTQEDWFPATLADSDGNVEIIRVTGRNNDTLTVQRSQEGTAAHAFAAGSTVELRLTADVMADIVASIESLEMTDEENGTAALRDVGTAGTELPSNNDLAPTFQAISDDINTLDQNLQTLDQSLGTASTKDTGTASSQVPLNSDLGTASTKDHGTANDQLPTTAQVNSLIQDAVNSLLQKDVGLIVYRSGDTPSSDEVIANGQTLLKADYPELWSYAQSSGNVGAAKGRYQSLSTTQFRVPDLRLEFIRSTGSGRLVGSSQAHAIEKHSHYTGITTRDRAEWVAGYAHQGYENSNRFSSGNNADQVAITVNGPAVTSNPISNNASITGAKEALNTNANVDTETRPQNIAYLPCIKVGRLVT